MRATHELFVPNEAALNIASRFCRGLLLKTRNNYSIDTYYGSKAIVSSRNLTVFTLNNILLIHHYLFYSKYPYPPTH